MPAVPRPTLGGGAVASAPEAVVSAVGGEVAECRYLAVVAGRHLHAGVGRPACLVPSGWGVTVSD